MPAAGMKLIHSGKVLKDNDTVEACSIQDNDFIVVMVTKPKKSLPQQQQQQQQQQQPQPQISTTTTTSSNEAQTTPITPSTSAPTESTTEATIATATPSIAAVTTTPPPTAMEDHTSSTTSENTDNEFPSEVVANLTALGFPETEVRHCLRAAHGNPDMAVEFLTQGVPPPPPPPPSSSQQPLMALRNHPQFNELKRLVQTNPAMLQQVLTLIGQQQPELLREINANQAAFLELMNEPILAAPPAATATTPSAPSSSAPASNPDDAMFQRLGGADPAQMAQMMQRMDPAQLQMMATMMGLSPEQVQAVGRMIGQLPPEQLQDYMAQAMMMGEGGMGGTTAEDTFAGSLAGSHIVRLTQEEMSAVDRLTEMGFDRSEAAQAFLACDKNEALAANLLMDGGFGGMDEEYDDDFQGGGGGAGGDDDDDMYS
jgi:UV excision repair protein RAD23